MTTEEMTLLIADYFKTQPVLKVWLFGSFSRGEERENSDVDLLILPDKSQHFSLFTLSGMYEDYSCFFYVQCYVSAGNLGYDYNFFVPD